MELLKLMGLCVVCLVPVLLLKRKIPELALLLTLAILCAAAVRCITLAAPVLKALEELFRRAGVESAYVSILLRTVAAALVTRLCAGLCQDGGSEALAGAVEIAGAVAALLIAMPLLQAVAELLLGYFT